MPRSVEEKETQILVLLVTDIRRVCDRRLSSACKLAIITEHDGHLVVCRRQQIRVLVMQAGLPRQRQRRPARRGPHVYPTRRLARISIFASPAGAAAAAAAVYLSSSVYLTRLPVHSTCSAAAIKSRDRKNSACSERACVNLPAYSGRFTHARSYARNSVENRTNSSNGNIMPELH